MKGLEDIDMEHVMDACTLQKPKTVGDVAHTFEDLERPRVAWTQLPACAWHQGLRRPVQKTEPYPVTDLELQRSMMSIIVALGVGLSLEQSIPDVGEKRVPILQELVDSRSASRAWLIWHQRWRWPTIDDLERRYTERGVESGIVAILCPWKPLEPSPGLITCNAVQVHGDRFIDRLRLAVRLLVEGGAHAQLNAGHLEQVAPVMSREHRVSVPHNR